MIDPLQTDIGREIGDSMKKIFWFALLFATNAFGAGKDYVPGFLLVNAASAVGNITSNDVDTRGWDNVDFEIIATGTPTGTFFVDCSLNQQMPPAPVAQTWVALVLNPVPVAAGVPTNIVIEVNQTGCMFMRLRYVATSGTGSITAYASEKQI